MKRITYTSTPDVFVNCVKITPEMAEFEISHAIARFELSDDIDADELVVHRDMIDKVKVAICNHGIIYSFYRCAISSNEVYNAMHVGTPF